VTHIFRAKFPKLRIIRGRDGRPVTETRTAKRGPRKGQRIGVIKREPDREDAGNVVMLESRKWAIEYTDAAGIDGRRGMAAGRGPPQKGGDLPHPGPHRLTARGAGYPAWGNMHLDPLQPRIALRASTMKSRRADTVAVDGELAATLRSLRHVAVNSLRGLRGRN